ncbi:MAG: hypothetical protein ACI35P_14915 [Bacillus sp. (in: firmicutes)]
MKRKVAQNLLMAMGISFIIGLVLIFSSGAIGESLGDHAIQANGGMMDTSDYERIITSNTENFRMGGAILSLVGGFGLLLSGYALYNEIEND